MRSTHTWQPDENNVNHAKIELERAFQYGKKNSLINPVFASVYDPKKDGRVPVVKPDDEFLTACAKIEAFLMDKHAVEAQFEKLAELLANNEGISLRQILAEELGKVGFFNEFGKTFGYVPPVAFRATIASGLLLKDASIGNENHGEFTHLIQWLAIAWQQEDSHFIGNNVRAIDIFKQMGEEKSVYERNAIFPRQDPKNDSLRGEKSVWDFVLDRFGGLGTNDFRSPEASTLFILNSNNPKLSHLKEHIKSRLEKRRAEGAMQKLVEKYPNPQGFYHPSQLKNVHEPKGSNIDYKAFRKLT